MKYPILAAALATSLLATPAMARDNAAYVEIAGGITAPNDSDIDYVIDPDIDGTIEWGTGYDIAGAAGYDFGAFRVEAEVGLKGHSFDRFVADESVIDASDETDLDFQTWSVMANALLDLGPDDGINGFVGGGVGFAGTDFDVRDDREGEAYTDGDSDTGFAWQLLAGIRYPVSENFSLGLKYRYFNQGDLSFDLVDDNDFTTSFSSHSVLLTATFDL